MDLPSRSSTARYPLDSLGKSLQHRLGGKCAQLGSAARGMMKRWYVMDRVRDQEGVLLCYPICSLVATAMTTKRALVLMRAA